MTIRTRTLTLFALVGVGLALASAAWAQTQAQTQPQTQTLKLAVINSQKAFETSAEGKRAAGQFQAREDQIKSNLARLDNELQTLETKLNTQRLTLSNEALLELQADIDRKTTDRKRAEEDSTKDYQQFQYNVIQKIRNEMIIIINQLSQERGFSLVLDVAASGIVYYDQAVDITDEVVRRYDASKAAAPGK
jgi:outer membrane protein